MFGRQTRSNSPPLSTETSHRRRVYSPSERSNAAEPGDKGPRLLLRVLRAESRRRRRSVGKGGGEAGGSRRLPVGGWLKQTVIRAAQVPGSVHTHTEKTCSEPSRLLSNRAPDANLTSFIQSSFEKMNCFPWEKSCWLNAEMFFLWWRWFILFAWVFNKATCGFFFFFLFVFLFAFNHDYQRSHNDTEFTPVDVGARVGQRRRSRTRVIRADRCLCLWPSCHVCSDVDQPDLLLHYVCLPCSNKPPTWDEEQLLWPGGWLRGERGRIRSAVTFLKKKKKKTSPSFYSYYFKILGFFEDSVVTFWVRTTFNS